MRLNSKTLMLLAAWTIGGAEHTACAQGSAHQLQRLVETSARRILIAEQVALAKWDSGATSRGRVSRGPCHCQCHESWTVQGFGSSIGLKLLQGTDRG